MRTSRDVRLAGNLISAVWAVTLLAAMLSGTPSPTGARGLVLAALGVLMGIVMATRAHATAARMHPSVLAFAVVANAVAATAALDAPWAAVAGTLTAAAAFAMGVVSDRDPALPEPAAAARRRRATPGTVHSRLVAAVAADPDRTALLLADADVLRAVRERCGELEGEELLREVAAELAAAAAPAAPAPATTAPNVDPHPLQGETIDARTPEHVT